MFWLDVTSIGWLLAPIGVAVMTLSPGYGKSTLGENAWFFNCHFQDTSFGLTYASAEYMISFVSYPHSVEYCRISPAFTYTWHQSVPARLGHDSRVGRRRPVVCLSAHLRGRTQRAQLVARRAVGVDAGQRRPLGVGDRYVRRRGDNI